MTRSIKSAVPAATSGKYAFVSDPASIKEDPAEYGSPTHSEPGAQKTIALTSALTPAEKEEFARCEETIRRGFQNFVEVGEALIKIHHEKLYRDHYERFEDYYREVWQYQKSQVYRFMGAAKVVRVLSPNGEKSATRLPQPLSEAQVRPLVGLKDAEIKKAWQKVTQEAKGGRITARLVQKQVRSIVPSTKKSVASSLSTPSHAGRDHVTTIKENLEKLVALIEGDKQRREKATALQQQIIDLVQRHTAEARQPKSPSTA